MKNGELHFSSEKDEKKKTVVIIIQKYVCKWMARRVLWIPVNTTMIPSCSLKHVWQLLTCLFYKDSMLNNETFMATTIIHSLQGFHIHYQMYVMARKL
jgi:hypothetical protein